VRLGRSADLRAGADENDPERLIVLQGALQQEPVARLKDVERQQHAREQHASQGEQRESSRLHHDQTVLCEFMATPGDVLSSVAL